MSVTFESDLPDEGLPTLEPCLCTQMDERFSQWFQYGPGEASVMKSAADPHCTTCRGTGVEGYAMATTPQLNFSNLNAEALLEVMGFKPSYAGEMTVAQARRGVMRARSRKSLESFVPTADWAKVFGSTRYIVPDQTAEHVQERIERFARFVEVSAELGAKKIRWY